MCFVVLVPGSLSEYPVKPNFAMTPIQLTPMTLQQQAPPLQLYNNNSLRSNIPGNNQVLDYLENQIRGLEVGVPQAAPPAVRNMASLQAQPSPPVVPYTPGPPSMLSALDEIGVKGEERRVITLPPIIERVPSLSSRRGAPGADGARGYPRMPSQSSSSTNRSGGGLHRDGRGYRDVDPPAQGVLRDYSDDSDWDNRRGRAPRGGSRASRNERGSSGGSRPRTRSRDDLLEELRTRSRRRERSHSPPQHRKGSWSSDEEDSSRRNGGRGRDWPEKPPSYFSIDPGRDNRRRNYDHFSVRP